jgi:hypothetical protein
MMADSKPLFVLRQKDYSSKADTFLLFCSLIRDDEMWSIMYKM